MRTDVKGTTMPVLEVSLDPGEEVISTHGSLSWISPNLQMVQTMSTGGGKGGLMRALGGGGVFLTRCQAQGAPATVAFAPGTVWLQSKTLPILAQALAPYLPGQGAAVPVAGGVDGDLIGDLLGKDA